MNAKSMILGLAPWFVFAWAAERLGADHVTLAAIAACALALAVTIYEAVRTGGGWKMIDVAGVVLFGVIALIGIVGDTQVDEALVFFGRGGSAFVLAAVMAVSAFTVPFTEQYARETVDPALWHSPVFRAKNRQISLLWAGAIALMGCSHIVAGLLASSASVSGSHPGNILLNWVVPIALIVFAVKRTRAIADAAPSAPAASTAPTVG
ncbi:MULTISPECIES: hypothetical protein [unclassified Gordonia (in: high G+C Gram-positive bacteria)]|uniref:hypothetical protein n=1 Tax=unclassified Gordonia (in: high G+C Gram-positive bacteria) TaxID=2657482 RepID=UPI00071C3EB2|nr:MULTISPECIES: hypothetical protein [unclassified Gordonia (in: high G+C Gram-positive bacteria)]SCC56641.1 hypothetical protein GA0061091_1284 [Gordonia sp. v-85]